MTTNGRRARAFWAICGACVGTTACWVAWGLAKPGDSFGDPSPLMWLSLFASGAAGGYAAFKRRSRPFRVALSLLTVASAVFWLAVPNGWWAVAPPRHVSGAAANPSQKPAPAPS